jgi:hypothetical protein
MNKQGRTHLRNEALAGGVINALINGLIAWLVLKGGPPLIWSGIHGFPFDILLTAFLLPFIVAAIVISLQRSKLAKGKLQAIHLDADSKIQTLIARMPRGVFPNALLFGLLGLVLGAPLTLLGLFALGVDTFAPVSYAIFKGVWAGFLAALLLIPMVLVALRDPDGQRSPGNM